MTASGSDGVRVVVAEDDLLMREGIAQVLTLSGLEVVGTAGDAEAVVEMVRSTGPDVLVTDIRMPPGHTDDGLRAAIALRSEMPGLSVMVLSQFVQRTYALELIGENPSGIGYLLKQRVADVRRFSADVRHVAQGRTVLDAEVVQAMLEVADTGTNRLDKLTVRQREVLGLVAEGRSNQAIAERLGITEKSVVQHVSNIYDVFALPPNSDDHRRVLAVVRYLSG